MKFEKINKNTFINLLIFFTSTLICLFFIEMVMRQIYPSFDPRGKVTFYETQENLILGLPNFSGKQWRTSNEFNVQVNINSYGFRDKKDLRNASKDDVFIIGDSFGFGHGVEEEERYGNILNELFLGKTEVYNIAISQSHFLNYQKRLDYVKNLGGEVKKIIVGVCMENDILNYDLLLKNKKIDSRRYFSPYKMWLNNNSCLYNFVAVHLKSNENLRKSLEKIGIIKDEIYELEPSSNQELKSSIEQLKNLMEGYKCIVVLIPSRMIWEEERKEVARETHERFKALLDLNNIQYLDLKHVFENYEENPLDSLHFKLDGHWNKQGHKVAAEAIFSEWEKIDLLQK